MYSKVDDELPSGTLTQTFHQLPPLVFFSLWPPLSKRQKKKHVFLGPTVPPNALGHYFSFFFNLVLLYWRPVFFLGGFFYKFYIQIV